MSYTNNGAITYLSERMFDDIADRAGWDTCVETFDETGSRLTHLMTLDNGVTRMETFEKAMC